MSSVLYLTLNASAISPVRRPTTFFPFDFVAFKLGISPLANGSTLTRPAYMVKTIALHSASMTALIPHSNGRALLSLTSPLAAVTIS